jgi:hypothetical protein
MLSDEFGAPTRKIKIGFTQGIKRRLYALQDGSPDNLLLPGTISGTLNSEQDLEFKFIKSHSHAEWFNTTPELLSFISQAVGREVCA